MYDHLDPVAPSAWGAIKAYDSWDYDPWNPDKLVVHYGGPEVPAGNLNPNLVEQQLAEMAQLQSWERYHVFTKKWRGIAYNYAIGQSGTLYRLRGENRSAATSGDYEGDGIPENHEARAVVFILGGAQVPTDAALTTFAEMWSVDELDVIVHQDVKTTACPGVFLTEWVHSGSYIPAPEGDEMPTIQLYAGYASKGLAHLRPSVKSLQIMLAHWGFADQNTVGGSCAADGWFGKGTDTQVRAFQRSRSLSPDGVVGPKTWAALRGE